MHWTQMPGGKEKMAAAQKKAWKTKRKLAREAGRQGSKYVMSDEGRRHISEGMRRRYAELRDAGTPHTITPAHKKRISQAMKARWALVNELESKGNNNASSSEEVPQDTFAYALGHIECWLETFSKSSDVSYESLAAKLGEVLQSKSVR